ncbi:hypothetical protein [Kitasatospora cineracea]|uniref:hypothetical protein n=1 Tax=Kitasatospora cineracea TaxID=88074 RepID=UPI0037873F96
MIIDTRSVRAAAGVPKPTTGLGANEKTTGRKRGLAVDVLGLAIGVVVLAAGAHDTEAGTALPDRAAERCGTRLEKALVGQGVKDAVIIHGAVKDITVEVLRRTPDNAGKWSVRQPKRRVVEQVSGTLMLHRRHAPPPHHPRPRLARRRRAGRVNVTELLRLVQAEHDGSAARADCLRGQIEQLTGAPAEVGARLAEISTSIPGRSSGSANCTNSSACPPTSPRSTSPTPDWDDSSGKDSSNDPDAVATRDGLNTL